MITGEVMREDSSHFEQRNTWIYKSCKKIRLVAVLRTECSVAWTKARKSIWNLFSNSHEK